MKKTVTALLIFGASLTLVSQNVQAHHTTISCESPGVWLIENSEADKSMEYTTDQGHSGSIGPGDSTTVAYSGTSLTVFGVWENGATNTNIGEGNCVIQTTTTTSILTSSTIITTTLPETTTSSLILLVTTTLSPTTIVTTTLPAIQSETTVIENPSTTTDPVTITSVATTSTVKNTLVDYTKPLQVLPATR